jgi:membrane-associated phospholipid phosphatase
LKKIALLIFIVFFPLIIYSQDTINNSGKVPITKLFYKMDKNIVGSFKCNYGLNYVIAGAATLGLIATNIDWNWYRYTYQNKWIYNTGYSAYYVGQVAPFVISSGIYLYGRSLENNELQITGLAVGQAAILGFSMSIFLKVLTGRVQPIYLKDPDDVNGDFRFGFLKGGVNNGWPSSHTCTAFAMASSLIALYPDNTAIKIGALTYATYIGIGVSTNVHWLSDVVAGALIGYAVGTTVGKSFRNLMNGTHKTQAFNFYATPLGVGFNYNF